MNEITMLKFWDRIELECPNYWKDVAKREKAFAAFCKNFKHIEESVFNRAISYVVQHLITTPWSWPTTAQIQNVLANQQHHRGTYKKPEGEDTRSSPGFKKFLKALENCEDVRLREYPSVQSLSSSLRGIFDNYVKAASRDERNRRMKQERKHLKKDSAEKGFCYYCGSKLYRPYDRKKLDQGIVLHDYFECPKCRVAGNQLRYE